jgi:hypothetical protein
VLESPRKLIDRLRAEGVSDFGTIKGHPSNGPVFTQVIGDVLTILEPVHRAPQRGVKEG